MGETRKFPPLPILLIGTAVLFGAVLCGYLVFGNFRFGGPGILGTLKVTVSVSRAGFEVRYEAQVDTARHGVRQGVAFTIPRSLEPYLAEELVYREISGERLNLTTKVSRILNPEIVEREDSSLVRLHDGHSLEPGRYEVRMNLTVAPLEANAGGTVKQFAWPVPVLPTDSPIEVEVRSTMIEMANVQAELRIFGHAKGPQGEALLTELNKVPLHQEPGGQLWKGSFRGESGVPPAMLVVRWEESLEE